MALIRGPYGGAQIKGSIGSQTYQGGPYGTIMRARSIPVNPRTPRQELVRTIMGTYSSTWRDGLTDSQRTGWANYAVATPLPNRFGDLINVGGRQMFLRTNLMRYLAGAAGVLDAPSLPGVPTSPTPEISIGEADGFVVAGTDPDLVVGECLSIFIGVPVNVTRNYYSGPFQLLATLSSTTTYPLTVPMVVPPVEGQKYVIRWRFSDALGRVSTDVQFATVVTA